MGAPAVESAEKRPEKRANAYEQCIISQAERGGATSNKIPDKSTFTNACAIFSCKARTKRAIFEMHPLRLVQPFLNLHGGRIRRPLLMSRAQRGGVLHAGSFFHHNRIRRRISSRVNFAAISSFPHKDNALSPQCFGVSGRCVARFLESAQSAGQEYARKSALEHVVMPRRPLQKHHFAASQYRAKPHRRFATASRPGQSATPGNTAANSRSYAPIASSRPLEGAP